MRRGACTGRTPWWKARRAARRRRRPGWRARMSARRPPRRLPDIRAVGSRGQAAEAVVEAVLARPAASRVSDYE
jgi:hypothetical protein